MPRGAPEMGSKLEHLALFQVQLKSSQACGPWGGGVGDWGVLTRGIVCFVLFLPTACIAVTGLLASESVILYKARRPEDCKGILLYPAPFSHLFACRSHADANTTPPCWWGVLVRGGVTPHRHDSGHVTHPLQPPKQAKDISPK